MKHAGKSLLFKGKPCIKKDSSGLGYNELNQLRKMFGKENIGLYRGSFGKENIGLHTSKSARSAEKTRKKLHECSEQFGLKFTAEANLRVV